MEILRMCEQCDTYFDETCYVFENCPECGNDKFKTLCHQSCICKDCLEMIEKYSEKKCSFLKWNDENSGIVPIKQLNTVLYGNEFISVNIPYPYGTSSFRGKRIIWDEDYDYRVCDFIINWEIFKIRSGHKCNLWSVAEYEGCVDLIFYGYIPNEYKEGSMIDVSNYKGFIIDTWCVNTCSIGNKKIL